MVSIRGPWLLACTLCLTVVPMPAHHSFGAEYDADKPVTLTGVLTKIEWTNPHSPFFMDVKDAKGNVAHWKFEGYPPVVLYRTGWKAWKSSPSKSPPILQTASPARDAARAVCYC